MPFSVSAATICSASTWLTRGSFLPWAMSSGIGMSSTRDSGERSQRKSCSVSGLPTLVWNSAIIGFQYSGTDSISVIRFDGPTMSTAHRNDVGRERGPDQRGVAAVRTAVDADPVRVDPALGDQVVDGVEQVVVHRAPPLLVAGVAERLAVAGRAPVVDLDADVAAVGEPLRLRVVAPHVAGPRPAVHVEHGRQADSRSTPGGNVT